MREWANAARRSSTPGINFQQKSPRAGRNSIPMRSTTSKNRARRVAAFKAEESHPTSAFPPPDLTRTPVRQIRAVRVLVLSLLLNTHT